LSDGQKKEIYRDVRFFHGALELQLHVTGIQKETITITIIQLLG